MKIRRPPRLMVIAWVLSAILIFAGILVGHLGVRLLGIALFVAGDVGVTVIGVLIYARVP
jgi:hypothetical protein